MNEDFTYREVKEGGPIEAGSFEERARKELINLFDENKKSAFVLRQLEVRLEDSYFHWLTSRVLRHLEGEGYVKSNLKELRFGEVIKTYWHRRNRYHKTTEKRWLRQ